MSTVPTVNKLSTGAPSTLGSYLDLTRLVFGTESKATSYIEDKIAESPQGKDEEVIAAETQMIYLLTMLHTGKAT